MVRGIICWNLPLLIIFPWKTAIRRGFLGDFPIKTSSAGISHGTTALSSCRLFGRSHPQASDQIRVKYTSNWTHWHIQIVRFPRTEIGSLIYLWYSLIYIYTHVHIYIYKIVYTHTHIYIYISLSLSLSPSLTPSWLLINMLVLRMGHHQAPRWPSRRWKSAEAEGSWAWTAAIWKWDSTGDNEKVRYGWDVYWEYSPWHWFQFFLLEP